MTSPSHKSVRAANAAMRVDFLCTGLDRIRRGYESFARECFDAFRDDNQVDIRLYKGSGVRAEKERALFCFSRNSVFSKAFAAVTGRSAYHVEQLTFLLSYLFGPGRSDPADIIFTSDANLANFLSRWRRRTGAGYSILYSNGGPILPPFPEYDHVQQVASPYFEMAMAAGESASKHSLVPYGIHVPEHLAAGRFPNAEECRAKLGLPRDRKILLSVGYISAQHKRMDYVVREVAELAPANRPFLLLVGQQDHSTAEIRALADSLLGQGNYRMASAPYSAMSDFYGSADAFVLASLKEGFGRVLLEASTYGLACMVDDNAVMRYVLGDCGFYADLRLKGSLANLVLSVMSKPPATNEKRERVSAVETRFGWSNLKPDYLSMFRKTLQSGRSHAA